MRFHNIDDSRENAKVFIGLLFLSTMVFVGFALLPAYDELNAQRAKYVQLRNEVSAGRTQANGLESFARKVARLRGEVIRIESQLSAEKAMPLVLRDAQKIASASKVKLVSIVPGTLTGKTGYSEQPVSFSLEASTAGLSSFIEGLESLPYVVRVNSADVTAGSLTGAGKLSVNLGATMYTLKKGGESKNETTESSGVQSGNPSAGK